jgi:hypothetical protein
VRERKEDKALLEEERKSNDWLNIYIERRIYIYLKREREHTTLPHYYTTGYI